MADIPASQSTGTTTPVGYIGIRRKGQCSVLVVVLAFVIPQLALVGILASGLKALPWQSSSSPVDADAKDEAQTLEVGDCVRKNASIPARPTGDTSLLIAESFTEVECEDDRAQGQVLELVLDARSDTEGCPPETDFFASQSSTIVCLQRLHGPHPGDPGTGGGVFRPGDCAVITDTDQIEEVACISKAAIEQVTARVKTVAECATPAQRFATLEGGRTRVLCLQPGPYAAAIGECITGPINKPTSFSKVDCTSQEAGAKILGRRSSIEECRKIAGETNYFEDPGGLSHSRVICLSTKTL